MTFQLSLLLPPTENPATGKKPVTTAFGGLRDPLEPLKEDGLVALDDALEFASLLLDAAPASTVEPDLTGNVLPTSGGNTLPVQDDAALLEGVLPESGESESSGSLLRPLSTATDGLLTPATIEDTGTLPGTSEPVLNRLPQLLENVTQQLRVSESGSAAPTLPIADTDGLTDLGAVARATEVPVTLPGELVETVQSQPANVAAVASAVMGASRNQTTGAEVDLPDTVLNESASSRRLPAGGVPVTRTEPIDETSGALLSSEPVDRALQWSGQARFAAAADARVVQMADTLAQADGAKISATSESTSASSVAAGAPVTGTTSTESAGGVRQVATLSLPLQDPRWGQQFAERVAMVVNSRASGAELRLNPEHLGPIELSIDVDGGEARVQFAAAHGVTRDAIEQQLPRLREMLSEQGLQLTDANVGDLPQRAARDEVALDPADGFDREQDDGENAPDPATARTVQTIGSGVIDTFA